MNVLIVYYKGFEGELIPGITHLLHGRGIKYSILDREYVMKKEFSGKDLVIVIGGDGTFLKASHYNEKVPMLGINPKPEHKEGFYMQADRNNYEQVLTKVIDGSCRIKKLLRLIVSINGKKLKQIILNEVYIGDSKPYTVFNYDLSLKGITEFQRSSGVLIGTPSGSHGWLKSACGYAMKDDVDEYQYVARELYEGRLTKDYKLRKGNFTKQERMEVVCRSQGIVVIDSISKEHRARAGDRITVEAGPDLNYILAN